MILRMRMKVVIDDKIPFIRGEVEKLVDEVVYLPGAAIGPTQVKDADALIVRTRTLCNRQLLEGSNVRFIATATIGYDHLDTKYLDEVGIQWTNCPGCNATSVGQYVRNALLEAERAGMIRLGEATVGIIGYGHVGKAVCNALRPYVKRILLNDPPLEKVESVECRVESLYSSLETLQEECDIITLHTPLTKDGEYPTWHLIDERFLNSLKRQPVIINAARGGVVDEKALLEAMDKGMVRQAIIDTWEGEPDINPTLLRRAFIATPHIAGYSADGKANATRMSLAALAEWLRAKGKGQRDNGKGIMANVNNICPPEAKAERTGLRYSPMEDSERLKMHPETFEKLRGNYPLRRE